MAISVALFGPNDRLPQYTLGEFSWLRVVGDGTQQVAAGRGALMRVILNVAGTRAAFYDALSTGTLDSTTLMANLPINTLAVGQFDLGMPFDDGLTVITTGAAADITVLFRARATVAGARTFGV